MWGRAAGWAYTSGSCQLSFFGFRRWMVATAGKIREDRVTQTLQILINIIYFRWYIIHIILYILNWPLLWACRTSERPDSTSPLLCCVHFSSRSLGPWNKVSAHLLLMKLMLLNGKHERDSERQCMRTSGTHMYSMVPQKVWVTVPSWIDSLHNPKSVNFTWPGRKSTNSSRGYLQTSQLSVADIKDYLH